MKTTEPTIGKQPLTGFSSRLPTATLDLRGRHEKPTLAQKVASIRVSEQKDLVLFDGSGGIVWSDTWIEVDAVGSAVGKYEGFRVG